MKKSFILFLLLAMGILSHIQAQIMVQGMPYSGKIQAPKIITANPTNTGFTMDDIKFWVGEGENQAALIIQWNDEREENTYVWGIVGLVKLRGMICSQLLLRQTKDFTI